MSAIAFRVATTNVETGTVYYSPEFPSLRLAINEARKVAVRGRRSTRVEQVDLASSAESEAPVADAVVQSEARINFQDADCACTCRTCYSGLCCGDQGCPDAYLHDHTKRANGTIRCDLCFPNLDELTPKYSECPCDCKTCDTGTCCGNKRCLFTD